MKLSEAMREGAKLRPQGFESYFPVSDDGTLCSCALGAAIEASTQEAQFNPQVYSQFADWGVFDEIYQIKNTELHDAIVDRNDTKRMSREEIADWLESEGR